LRPPARTWAPSSLALDTRLGGYAQMRSGATGQLGLGEGELGRVEDAVDVLDEAIAGAEGEYRIEPAIAEGEDAGFPVHRLRHERRARRRSQEAERVGRHGVGPDDRPPTE